MRTMKYLCVNGPMCGRYINVERGRNYMVPIRLQEIMISNPFKPLSPGHSGMTMLSYEPVTLCMRINEGVQEVVVYAMTADSVIDWNMYMSVTLFGNDKAVGALMTVANEGKPS